MLAYLWDKEGHLRRAVTVLQRIMTLVVEVRRATVSQTNNDEKMRLIWS